MTIETRLAEIRARVENATPGPWEAIPTADNAVVADDGDGYWTDVADRIETEADAEFIAASRTDLPALLAAVEAVRELHQPVEVEPSETICAGCSTLRGQGETARYFPFTEYPCPTVTRIQEALNGIA